MKKKIKFISEIDLNKSSSACFPCRQECEEINKRINKRKFNIKQIPIVFADRAKGYSKIPKLEIFRTLKNLLILFFKK